MDTSLDKFTVSLFKDGTQRLERNGKPQVCQFRNPYMTPGRMQGNFNIMKETCNNSCPQFQTYTNSITQEKYCKLHCTGLMIPVTFVKPDADNHSPGQLIN